MLRGRKDMDSTHQERALEAKSGEETKGRGVEPGATQTQAEAQVPSATWQPPAPATRAPAPPFRRPPLSVLEKLSDSELRQIQHEIFGILEERAALGAHDAIGMLWNTYLQHPSESHLRVLFSSRERVKALVNYLSGPDGFAVEDRKFHLRTYEKCFVGSEAVTWLVDHVNEIRTREEAVLVGQHLLQNGVFCHVVMAHSFHDEGLFYRFIRRKRVVVVGGGFAGSLIAKELQSTFDVMLIDTKPYFEATPSIPFLIGDPMRHEVIRVMHKDYLSRARIIQAHVQSIGDHAVVLRDGSRVEYSNLVICTGSRYETPWHGDDVFNPALAKDLIACNEYLKTCASAAVIGTGPTGIEVAGQLAVCFPDLKLYVITKGDKLMERAVDNAHSTLEEFFSRCPNVELIFNDVVKTYSAKTLLLGSGRNLKVDALFPCIGFKPNTQPFQETMPEVLDAQGFVKANEYLQLEEHPEIFVCGDIVGGLYEEKLAQAAQRHAAVVASNVRRVNSGRALKSYAKAQVTAMLVSAGPKHAMLVSNQTVVMQGSIASKLKAFVEYKVMRDVST